MGDPLDEVSRDGKRERNAGSWFVSVIATQRAYSTGLSARTHGRAHTLTHSISHIGSHTHGDERTIYLPQQSVLGPGSRRVTR